MRTVLWWGRFDTNYSRNRILRHLLIELGYRIIDFHPHLSKLGYLEACLKGLDKPDLVWVPCFRQRDVAAASRWAREKKVPLLFDPLISVYDKQVFERKKIQEGSTKALKLLKWERELVSRADILLADTSEHEKYFTDVLGARNEKVKVVLVGAEEALFKLGPVMKKDPGAPLEVLFYGSFIPLQGASVIVEAARKYHGPPVRWILLGAGPELDYCKQAAKNLKSVTFEPWMEYSALPERIRRADILLGIFGTTAKSGRVIPNKVFQALACGKPIITRSAAAYPDEISKTVEEGLVWVAPGDSSALAEAVTKLAEQPEKLPHLGYLARSTYDKNFSETNIKESLARAIAHVPYIYSYKT